MTPYELHLYAEAFADKQRQTAYLQAMTIRAVIGSFTVKRPPSYEQLFKSEPAIEKAKKAPNMTARQMFNNILALNKAFGGNFVMEGGEPNGNG